MKSCKRCGACCKDGGPALHTQDLRLFNDVLQIENCITIRKSEPAFNPLPQRVEPAQCELIKITGISNSWQCCFFKEDQNQCKIYNNRPVECSLLKCWDTEELTQVIFTDTLSRADIITDASLLKMIQKHDVLCSYNKFSDLVKDENHLELNKMLNLDMTIRQEAITKHTLSLSKELFCFGRPMFKSAAFYNVAIKQTSTGFEVIF